MTLYVMRCVCVRCNIWNRTKKPMNESSLLYTIGKNNKRIGGNDSYKHNALLLAGATSSGLRPEQHWGILKVRIEKYSTLWTAKAVQDLFARSKIYNSSTRHFTFPDSVCPRIYLASGIASSNLRMLTSSTSRLPRALDPSCASRRLLCASSNELAWERRRQALSQICHRSALHYSISWKITKEIHHNLLPALKPLVHSTPHISFSVSWQKSLKTQRQRSMQYAICHSTLTLLDVPHHHSHRQTPLNPPLQSYPSLDSLQSCASHPGSNQNISTTVIGITMCWVVWKILRLDVAGDGR